MDETTKFTSHVSWAMAFCVRQTTFSCSDGCGDNKARSSIQDWHHTMFVLIPGFELKSWDGFMWEHLVWGSFQVKTFRVYLLLWSKELTKLCESLSCQLLYSSSAQMFSSGFCLKEYWIISPRVICNNTFSVASTLSMNHQTALLI
jgi:hypothetical protein